MPMAPVNGIELYYEEHGSGFPLVFSHEFAGDYRSWNQQVNFFSPPLPRHHLQRSRLPAVRRSRPLLTTTPKPSPWTISRAC